MNRRRRDARPSELRRGINRVTLLDDSDDASRQLSESPKLCRVRAARPLVQLASYDPATDALVLDDSSDSMIAVSATSGAR